MASRFLSFNSLSRKLFGKKSLGRLYDPTRGVVGKQFVELETRVVPTTYTVTNILDNQFDNVGGFSLRQAINAANSNPGFDNIVFNIPRSPSLPTLPGDPTENYFPIVLASTLPDLTDPAGVSIDAFTQPRTNVFDPANSDAQNFKAVRPIVQLLPDPNPGAFPGQLGAFFISGPNNVVRGLVITGFPGAAINMAESTAKNNIIIGNWINTDITGLRSWNEDPFILSARPPGTAPELTNTGPNADGTLGGNAFPLFVLAGITITNGASNNTIGGTLSDVGLPLVDAGGTVIGGYADAKGNTTTTFKRFFNITDSFGNTTTIAKDIPVTAATNRNVISGTPEFRKDYFNFLLAPNNTLTVRARDVAGAGSGPGIRIMDPGTKGNLVQGNFIGTDVTGNGAIPNHNGIEIYNSAQSNLIGNPFTGFVGDPVAAGVGNLIRFNENDGIRTGQSPNPSGVSPPPIAGGPAVPYNEGDDGTTVTAPGSFGPSHGNARVAFFDELNPNYYIGQSPAGPNIVTVTATGTADPGLVVRVGQVFKLHGSGFISTTAVTFASTPSPAVSAKFNIVDDNLLEVTVPNGAISGTVNVFTPAGTANADAEILLSSPAAIETVSLFSPSSGVAGSIVRVQGTNFTGAQSVTIGGVAATKYTVAPGGTSIDIVVPTGALTGLINIITPVNSATSTREFVVDSQPPPLITSIFPTSAVPGQEVTLTGINFTGAFIIRFNTAGGFTGIATTDFTVDSPTQIRVKVPALATPSLGKIQVTTNDGSGFSFDTINGRDLNLQITAPPTPTLAALSSTSGVIGSFITLTGTNFTSASRVTFSLAGGGSIDAPFTIVSGGAITATVPFGLPINTVTQVRVHTVSNSSATQNYTVLPSLLPTIQPIPTGIRNNFVVVNGTNLSGTTQVIFDDPNTGTPAVSFQVLSDTQIRVQIPPSVSTSGSYFLKTAYHSQNPLEPPAQSTYMTSIIGAPTISVGRQSNPISGIIGSVVTLRGIGFTSTQQVLFSRDIGGTVPAENLNIVSDFEINFTVPQFAADGILRIVAPGVPDPNTPFSPTDPPEETTVVFDVLPSPVPKILGDPMAIPASTNPGISPQSGSVGTVVTISGTGFTGAVQVKFGNAVADDFTVESDSVIKVRAPALAQSGSISVQTNGGIASSFNTFTVTAAGIPTLNFSTPRAARNTQVTIAGTNLAGTSKVSFNDVAAQFTVISDSLITAIVPLSAGPGEIRVITPGGTAASPIPFALASVTPPVIAPFGGFPALESPDALPVGGTFIISGNNLLSAKSVMQVSVGGVPARFDYLLDSNFVEQIVVTIPEVDAGPQLVEVFAANNLNGAPAANSDFSYSTATNILGSFFEYGELLTVLPNARPTITAMARPAGDFRGAPLTLTGTGFLGANLIRFAGTDPVTLLPFEFDIDNVSGQTLYRVTSDSTIVTDIPIGLPQTVALDDVVVTVFTPFGIANFAGDDLPSLQTDATVQLDVPAIPTLTWTAAGAVGKFFGSTVTLTATSGNFFATTSITGTAKNANPDMEPLGTAPVHFPTPITAPQRFNTVAVGKAHTDYDLGFTGSTTDLGMRTTFVVNATGTAVTFVVPTGFAPIPDGKAPVVAPGSPPAPVPPPAGLIMFTATDALQMVSTEEAKVNRPSPNNPTITTKAGTNYNRVWSITGNAALISTQGLTIQQANTPDIFLGRDQLQVTGGGAVTIRFIMPAILGTGDWPTGNVVVSTTDGLVNTTFAPAAQPVPSIFAFATQPIPTQDNRFAANRVFDNGLTITRDATTTFVTGVVPKTQTQKAAQGVLGVDFVTTIPSDSPYRGAGNLGITYDTQSAVLPPPYYDPTLPFWFGYAYPGQQISNTTPGGNGGLGGINDGLNGSFSLPSAVSVLPTNPAFAATTLPSGAFWGPGQNTFNNTQYGRYYGPNLLQNFPLLQVVQSTIDRTTFSTALLGKPFRSYRIDYYYNPGVDNTQADSLLDPFLRNQATIHSQATFDPPNFDDQDVTARATTNIGAGQIYLGSKIITTDDKGDGSVSFEIYKRLPGDPAPMPGDFLLPNNTPLEPSAFSSTTGAIITRSGVVVSTATDLTAAGPDGPTVLAGPDGTSRMSFFKRPDTPQNSISGQAIIDKNNNNVIDSGELGVEGATVNLFVFDARKAALTPSDPYNSTPTDTALIDMSGNYLFGIVGSTLAGDFGIPNGKHKLTLTLPTGGTTTFFYETPADGVNFASITSGNVVSNVNFLVTTTPVVTNTPPTISNINNQSVPSGSVVGPLNFTIGDLETAVGSLTVTATSSNGGVVTNASIILGGSGANRTITLPTTATSGNTTITVTVTDGGGLTATDTFVIASGSVGSNTPPTISDITDVTTKAGALFSRVFTIGDAETPLDNLQVSFTTSNGTVVPAGNITITGTGASRTVNVQMPAGAIQGASTVTLTVSDDGGLSASDSFIVTVPPPAGTAPKLIAVGSDAGRTSQVSIYNPDGTFRYTLTPYGDGFTGGVRVATGDVNGDGNADIITAPGAGTGGLVKVYSGVSGEFITSFLPYGDAFKGGVYVVTGDVDGDGILDITTGTGQGGGPRVRVFRGGATGNPAQMNLENLADFFAYENRFRQGVLVSAGDVNGDGKADIITATGPGAGPRVRVLDGTKVNALDGQDANAAAATLFDFFAYSSSFRGGVFATVGDVDGDGQAEIITGTGVKGGPVVKVFRKTTLAAAATAGNATPVADTSILAYDQAFRGGVRVDITDGNNDGIADIITAPGFGLPGNIRVINFNTQQDIYRIDAFEPSFRGGVFVGGNVK